MIWTVIMLRGLRPALRRERKGETLALECGLALADLHGLRSADVHVDPDLREVRLDASSYYS